MYPDYYSQEPKNGPKDNYSAKAKRKQINYQNNDYNIDYQTGNEYQNPLSSSKIILYQDGYTINNGPLNDIKIPQNKIIFAQLEKSIIPQEIFSQGITNANVFDQRKNIEYIAYPQDNIKKKRANKNQNMYINNAYQNNAYLDQYYQDNVYQNDAYQNINKDNAYYNYPQELYEGQYYNNMYNNNDYGYQNDIYMNNINYNINNLNIGEYPVQNPKKQVIPSNSQKRKQNPITQKNKVIQPPIQNKAIPNNNVIQKKEPEKLNKDIYQNKEPEQKTNVEPKKEKKNVRTFGSWIKEQKEKEEEEKMRKMQKIKKEAKEVKEPIKEEPKEKEEEKKFVPFVGEGFNVANVNVEGLYVKRDVKHSLNELIPMCHLNIRLFNGEVIKTTFNYTQTLASIYKYVKKISGSNNFILVEGFPPRPLKDLNKCIKDLNLDNTTLTQKLSENMNI